MYRPPAMFPRPITEPISLVIASGAAVRDRIRAIEPPAMKNE
jgi:hypothetical protein